MNIFKLELGTHVFDDVSEFEGIINARLRRDSGNIQYSVKPPVKENGEMAEAWWLDGENLSVNDVDKSIDSKYLGEPDFKYNNGDIVRSLKSPYRGVVAAQMQYLNGCLFYEVTSDKLEKGLEVTMTFSETELKPVAKAKSIKQEQRPTGGPESRSGL